MLVVIPFCHREEDQAFRLLRWIAELGNVSTHDVLIQVPSGVSAETAEKAMAIVRPVFRECELYHLLDDCVDMPFPFPHNFTFKRCVDYVDLFKKWPFLFLEPDAIPLCPEWLNRIEAEYNRARKPFMGYLEYAGQEKIQHINGVAVYGDIMTYAPSLVSSPIPQSRDQIGQNFMSFDVGGAAEMLPHTHVSPLFQFQYQNEAKLLKDTSLSWLNPDAVIFHTEKTGGLIELLRARRNGTPYVSKHPERTIPIEAKSHEPDWTNVGVAGPSCDIFIKTWQGDAIWHEHCLRSIDKYCTGFRKVVQNHEEHERGYLYQQVVKLNADRYTDADYILHTDSDTLFTVPVTPQAFIHNGKTDWHYEPFASALQKEGDGALAWKRAMEKFIGEEPQHEFMRRHPEMIPRWLYQAFRTFCWEKHGCTVEQYVMSQKEFSEWNVLGFYAWTYHREAFNWIDASVVGSQGVVHQFWTGPHNQTLEQRHERARQAIPEMQAILAGAAPQNPAILTVHVVQENKEPATKKRQASPKMLAALERAREEKRKKQLAKA